MSRLRAYFPLSLSGLALLALSAASVWAYGVRQLDLVLLAAGALMGALTVALALCTTLAAFVLRRRLRRREADLPRVVEGGAWTATSFVARAPRLLPFLELRAAWEDPRGLEARLDPDTGEEEIRATRRGHAEGRLRRLTLRDILGLSSLTWWDREAAPLEIRPARMPLDPELRPWGQAAGDEDWHPRAEPAGDRVEVRRYVHGDPLRMILWKIFARTGQLVVRTPERALAPAPRLCAYLPAAPGDEAAAEAARAVLEAGLLGEGWRFGADGAEPAESLEAALSALARSGSVPEGAPSGLPGFLAAAAAGGFGACLVFLPAEEGPWVPRLAPVMAESPMPLHVLLAFRTWDEGLVPLWKRALFRPAEGAGLRAETALGLIRTLQGPDVRCTLVEARRGLLLEDPEAYLVKRADAERRSA